MCIYGLEFPKGISIEMSMGKFVDVYWIYTVFFLKLLPTTLPETNIAPANGWLEDEYPFGKPYCQVLC